MKVTIVLAFLFAICMSATFDDVKALVKNDQCAMDKLETIRPQLHIQIQKLKEVISYLNSRTQITSLPRLNSWYWYKRLKKSTTNATSARKSNQFWEMLSRLPVSDFCSPQAASRTSELFCWLVMPSSKTQLTLSTMFSSSSSWLFLEDNRMLTALNSSDTFCDLLIDLILNHLV